MFRKGEVELPFTSLFRNEVHGYSSLGVSIGELGGFFICVSVPTQRPKLPPGPRFISCRLCHHDRGLFVEALLMYRFIYALRLLFLQLFPGTKGPTSPMSEQSFRRTFKKYLVMLGVSICFHITHLARQSMNFFNAKAGSPLENADLDKHGVYAEKLGTRERTYTTKHSENTALFLSQMQATDAYAAEPRSSGEDRPFCRFWLLETQVPTQPLLDKCFTSEREHLEQWKKKLSQLDESTMTAAEEKATNANLRFVHDREVMVDYYALVLINGLCDVIEDLPHSHFIWSWPLVHDTDFKEYRVKFLAEKKAGLKKVRV